ncbi:MAG: epimerase [Glaciihabitans sp.]|nr:epimerase [Glaciihabitans sp.]
MRIVVVGATGNVGTAVLRRLQAAEEVTEIVGFARRTPDVSAEPYAGVSWYPLDIGETTAVPTMTRLFAGADAVIHLGWALQPNHNEPAMRRTNVSGTAHVLAAVAAAKVPQVVVASSVGAYSSGPKHRRVNESWPTGGLATSHYSRYKAINERALDDFEKSHTGIIVTRLRPGLIFQRDAGAEVGGLFLGRHFPTRWLKAIRPPSLRLPVLPLPSQAIFQAVHADDVADAFWRAIDRRARGAFNIAAEPVLNPANIAETFGARSTIPIRAVVVRWAMAVSWHLRIQATDPGWLDIALNVPVMSTERARRILDWEPQVSSTDALAEILDGLTDRSNYPASGPLRG